MKKSLLGLGAALALSGCFSFGAKPPPTLMTLNSTQAREAGATRTAGPGETITVVAPQTARELQTVRVPVRQSDIAVAYLKDAQWLEQPANLFARLLSETIAATTGRVVLDPRQFTFDPGTRLTGTLQEFGLDATRMEVVARYDAALARQGGGVVTRRFEARVPVTVADATSVSPALNQAANEVATQVAAWVGGTP
jgi:cholesterol transport system auxiliary component